MLKPVNVKQPIIAKQEVNIRDHGAVSDGKTLNTNAINAAIKACAQQGGGRVVIPAGFWLTGPIILQDNIDLHVEQGALVVFTGDFEQYPLRVVNLNGVESVMVTPPLFGENLKNVAITGKGIFDGSGHKWRPVKKFKTTDNQWNKVVSSGGVVDEKTKIWWPTIEALHGEKKLEELLSSNAPLAEYDSVHVYLRPRLMNLVNCKYILIDGPTFQNSPMWNLHPILCSDLTIRNINVRNPWYSQNGDGLDIESCRNVLVENSTFDVGDDAICLKAGKDEMGRKIGVRTENVIIRNCVVYHGHGGFVVGSEMSGGVRNVKVSDCQFIGTDVGLRFKSTRGRGGVVENISINNIDMIDIAGAAISFDLYYEKERGGATLMPVTIETPQFKNFSFSDVSCRGAEIGIFLRGLPEMPLENLRFDRISITADAGVVTDYCEDLSFNDVQVEDSNGVVLYSSDS